MGINKELYNQKQVQRGKPKVSSTAWCGTIKQRKIYRWDQSQWNVKPENGQQMEQEPMAVIS